MKKVAQGKVARCKMKGEGGSSVIEPARLAEMIEEATMDCYEESEQMTGCSRCWMRTSRRPLTRSSESG